MSAPAPGKDDVVGQPPTEVAWTFSAQLLDLPTSMVVTGQDGSVVAEGTPNAQRQSVALPLPPALPDGEYQVTWSVVSSDGHRTQD